eukprot:TRINITY_DN3419_c0_g3_i1.p1 TRINITY_DN3419_c0_g3~~TRINITY_DN3419_c0_g3_i1.p1  ORF type:complete len:859 (-),score=123.85 TRINITY_DN3419_c0_g3_i1:255-2831(-)
MQFLGSYLGFYLVLYKSSALSWIESQNCHSIEHQAGKMSQYFDKDIDLQPAVITQLSERLAQKRAALEKELDALGEEPKNQGVAAIFTQCRGFARVFEKLLNDTDKAAQIRELFHGTVGMTGKAKRINWSKEFTLDIVKRACRQADGYQPHLVSPEKGLQKLTMDALNKLKPIVQETVVATHQLLLEAAKEALAHASEGTEMGDILKISTKSRLPKFESTIMASVTRALEEWKADSMEKSLILVDMERSYVSISFFRQTMHERMERERKLKEMQQTESSPEKEKKGWFGGKKGATETIPEVDNGSDEDDLSYRAPTSGQAQRPQLDAKSVSVPPTNKPVDLRPILKIVQSGQEFSEENSPLGFLIGELWKRKSEGGAFNAISSEVSLWQKRYFVFSDDSKELYYFPDLQPRSFMSQHPHKRIDLTKAAIEEIDPSTTKLPHEISTDRLSDGDKVSMILRLRHKEAGKSLIKDHPSMLLCASSAASMFLWRARLSSAADPMGGQLAKLSARPKEEEAGDGEKEGDSYYAGLSTGPSPVDGEKPDGLGLGSPYFKAKGIRTRTGRLLPSPGLLVASSLAARGKGNPEDLVLKEFARDMTVYCDMVCDTLITTVPKAIVYCQVKRAQDDLLIKMQNHIIHIQQENPAAIDDLLEEDPEFEKRRMAAREALQDVRSAIYVMRDIIDGKHERVVPAKYAIWAGSYSLLPSGLSHYRDMGILVKQMYGEFAPQALMQPPEPKRQPSMPIQPQEPKQSQQPQPENATPKQETPQQPKPTPTPTSSDNPFGAPQPAQQEHKPNPAPIPAQAAPTRAAPPRRPAPGPPPGAEPRRPAPLPPGGRNFPSQQQPQQQQQQRPSRGIFRK